MENKELRSYLTTVNSALDIYDCDLKKFPNDVDFVEKCLEIIVPKLENIGLIHDLGSERLLVEALDKARKLKVVIDNIKRNKINKTEDEKSV